MTITFDSNEAPAINDIWNWCNRQWSGTFNLGTFAQQVATDVNAVATTYLPLAGGAMVGGITGTNGAATVSGGAIALTGGSGGAASAGAVGGAGGVGSLVGGAGGVASAAQAGGAGGAFASGGGDGGAGTATAAAGAGGDADLIAGNAGAANAGAGGLGGDVHIESGVSTDAGPTLTSIDIGRTNDADISIGRATGSVTIYSDLSMDSSKITSLGSGSALTDAANLSQLPDKFVSVAMGAEVGHKRILTGTLADPTGAAIAASSNCILELFGAPPTALACEAASGTDITSDILTKHSFLAFQTKADGTFAIGITLAAGAQTVMYKLSGLATRNHVGLTTFD